MKLKKGSHSVYSIHLHLVFVTKYRHKVITAPMLVRIGEIFSGVCAKSKKNGLVPAPRFLRQAGQRNKQLSKAKRRKRSPNFKKKIKASRRWKTANRKVGALSRKVAFQRQNWVHQETTRIVSGNSTVVTEKLEVKKMSAKAKKGKRKKQKAGLNKSILDVGMGMIKGALKAKLADVGGVFLELPTRQIKPSQTCPKCGHQEKKDLSQRLHECKKCTYTQQRDIAAAEVMLLWYSKNLQELGTSFLDVDGSSSTSSTRKRKQAGSMKQLGQLKRQKSQATLEDVETSGSTQ